MSPTRAELYPWIVRRVFTRPAPPPRPLRGRRPAQIRRRQNGCSWVDGPCGTCGYEPVGWRKRCPACRTVVAR